MKPPPTVETNDAVPRLPHHPINFWRLDAILAPLNMLNATLLKWPSALDETVDPVVLMDTRLWGNRLEELYKAYIGQSPTPAESPPDSTPSEAWSFLSHPLPDMHWDVDNGVSLARYNPKRVHPSLFVARFGGLSALDFLLQQGSPIVLSFVLHPTSSNEVTRDCWLADVAARRNLAGALDLLQHHAPPALQATVCMAWLSGCVEGLRAERVAEAKPWWPTNFTPAPGSVPYPMELLLRNHQHETPRMPDMPAPLVDDELHAPVGPAAAATLDALLDLAPLVSWFHDDGHGKPRASSASVWLRSAIRDGNPWAVNRLIQAGAEWPSMTKVDAWAREDVGQGRQEQDRRTAFTMVEQHWLNETMDGITPMGGPLQPKSSRRRL